MSWVGGNHGDHDKACTHQEEDEARLLESLGHGAQELNPANAENVDGKQFVHVGDAKVAE